MYISMITLLSRLIGSTEKQPLLETPGERCWVLFCVSDNRKRSYLQTTVLESYQPHSISFSSPRFAWFYSKGLRKGPRTNYTRESCIQSSA
ncbi:hypothetical protein SLEP1_g6649 [Rubroshorea leprosula]|nr:hypothetical protein SLEP1_g6649 [Rubroshorea leprosula]